MPAQAAPAQPAAVSPDFQSFCPADHVPQALCDRLSFLSPPPPLSPTTPSIHPSHLRPRSSSVTLVLCLPGISVLCSDNGVHIPDLALGWDSNRPCAQKLMKHGRGVAKSLSCVCCLWEGHLPLQRAQADVGHVYVTCHVSKGHPLTLSKGGI